MAFAVAAAGAFDRFGGDRAFDQFGGGPAFDRFGPDRAFDEFGGDPAFDRFGPDRAFDEFGGDPALDRSGGTVHPVLPAFASCPRSRVCGCHPSAGRSPATPRSPAGNLPAKTDSGVFTDVHPY